MRPLRALRRACTAVSAYDYVFSENGLVAHKGGALLAKQDLVSFLGEAKLRPFIDFVLRYVADLDIPVKVHCAAQTRCHAAVARGV